VVVVVVVERIHLDWTLERELHLGLLGMLLDCAEQERDRAIATGFLGSGNSSSVQQVQMPYARSHSFFDHKSSSSSCTTTWRRGRSTWRSLLLRVCVHPQFHFTKKKLLLLYTALLPKVHWMETEAVLRDHGYGKFFCVVTLCVSA
jgi:hypothetical protein